MCTNVFELWENVPLFSGAHTPTLDYYKAENRKGNGTVIILPGGAYRGRAAHEGKGYAEYLNAQGLDCFVLQYRCAPTRFPYPLLDARRAMRYVRANAEKYGISFPQRSRIRFWNSMPKKNRGLTSLMQISVEKTN